MKKAKKLSGVSFIRAFIPFIRGAPSWLDHPQRPHSKYHHLVIQHINFEGTQTFSLSVQLRRSVMSNSSGPHDLQLGRLPYHQLPELAQTHVCRVGDAIQPSHPVVPFYLLPSIFPSIRVFSNESVLHIRWPKYWSFSFSISPSNEYWGLISFRMDWLDLLAVQGNLKSLLQHHSSKASILWYSVLFMV